MTALPPPYEISDDRTRLDLDAVWAFLSTEAYWGRWRARADFDRQVGASWRLLGLYAADAQVGFARVVSDGVAVAYLADVYVHPDHRGHGLGRALVEAAVEGPGATCRWLLHTADAHDLYRRFGFAEPDATLLERPARR